ncbi:TPA: hypothetical protein MYV03_000490 [Escherichia coli]|uniref:hypothetical protein n=1 Tax=Escherichia coli TaxID=562 RepID=UPI000D0BE4C5|nr:hypothetical protein [Escherichia coli]MCK2325981.1 hypothetical protein [Escherichia coli]HCB3419530.1 hypothetical protein [Escherichia coli]HEG2087212.1 hypothetical protein [Escherichia coli]
MECKVSDLVKRGHEQSAQLKSSGGALSQLISDLATQLDVQLARSNALAADNAWLKGTLSAVIDRSNEPDYQSIGMGCGVEDNGLQTDGYNACEYGWLEAMDRIYSEVIPDTIPETPATDAFLAEVRAQARNEGINYAASRLAAAYNHGFVDKPLSEVYDVVRMILTAKEDLVNDPAADGLSGEYAEKALVEFAAQLRQGAGQ